MSRDTRTGRGTQPRIVRDPIFPKRLNEACDSHPQVPLPRQAVSIILRCREVRRGPYLFPSLRSTDRPISENTLNAALRRMGFDKTEMCAHGFRRMASTRLNEAGFNPDWIERQLAHADAGSIRGIYNAAEYLEGRKAMMQWWADYLDDLRQNH